MYKKKSAGTHVFLPWSGAMWLERLVCQKYIMLNSVERYINVNIDISILTSMYFEENINIFSIFFSSYFKFFGKNFFINSSGFPTKLPWTSTKIWLVYKIFPTKILKLWKITLQLRYCFPKFPQNCSKLS